MAKHFYTNDVLKLQHLQIHFKSYKVLKVLRTGKTQQAKRCMDALDFVLLCVRIKKASEGGREFMFTALFILFMLLCPLLFTQAAL